MKYTVGFSAWYLNVARIGQLLRLASLEEQFPTFGKTREVAFAGSLEGQAISHLNTRLEEWLATNAVPSLGELLITEKPLAQGQPFTIFHDFYGKGLSKYNDGSKPLPRNAAAEIYAKPKYTPKKLRILYSPHNLTSATAWTRLGGHTKLFAFCYIEEITEEEIIARPYMIGDIHQDFFASTPTSWRSASYGEVHASLIDQFSKIRDIEGTPSLLPLKSISETAVKTAIVEIIGEKAVPKDWGGEQSDFFTTNLSIEGRRVSAAFLLKGPARFSEMKITHLGKNGDQIVRLFNEPADLLILQHCHQVSTPVRSMMKAFASRVYDMRHFTIIDGYDTMRLLKAYGKCGV